jgi:GDP-L-fucose synthase
MDKQASIFVAGHRGLVGSALVRALNARGHHNLLLRASSKLDLADGAAVAEFFAQHRPDYVLLAAAKVGGILANRDFPADFIRINLAIQSHVIHNAFLTGCKRLLFLGSSCIYPRDAAQPIAETALLTGPLEETNSAYALAKIAGVEMCRSYNFQHGTRYLCAMPTNLYGIGDNYDLATSHVLPALLRKFLGAKNARAPSVTVWGSGTPLREFLISDDLADACLHLMNLPDSQFDAALARMRYPLINVGFGDDLTIAALAALIKDVVGYDGELLFDRTKPDGTPRKLIDSTQMRSLGWVPKTALRDGLAVALADFTARGIGA